jgi:hypothetical protein
MHTNEEIQDYLSIRIDSLKPNSDYTVRQIFRDFVRTFNGNECRLFGKRIKKMVELGKLPLQLTDDTHSALKYRIKR